MKIKNADEISRNYRDAIPRVPEAYKRGVSAVSDWQEKAVGGQELYEAKMRDGEVLKRRATSLGRVSNEEWRTSAAVLGSTRIGAGMDKGVDKQRRNFSPYREAIANTTIPERTADPMTNVDNRLKPIVKALVDVKKAQG